MYQFDFPQITHHSLFRETNHVYNFSSELAYITIILYFFNVAIANTYALTNCAGMVIPITILFLSIRNYIIMYLMLVHPV